MAFIRNCVIAVLAVFCIVPNAKAQVVYYPAQASQLTKATAADAAMLLQKAIPGSQFTTQPYTVIPTTGIVLMYDTTITDNQACKATGNGNNFIKFTAAEDNGLHYGIYQYLQQNGFRFYLPGAAWQITPTLTSAFKNIDTIYTCSYKYKTWFISGGHSKWIMDNASNSTWAGDAYAGENGHNWSLYQRRNGMLGSASFQGHRGDIMSGTYLTTLQTNPCYVANFNGSRQADMQSVPDIFNNAAKDLWANTIEQKYTQYKNTIYVGASFYVDLFRNFKYNNNYIGLEVPDVAKFGNSKDNEACNAVDYPKESDQHFALANYSAEKIMAKYPNKRFQLYAYSGHADVPSSSIAINKNIDIQLVPTVYQVESSTDGLRNRWYNRSNNISEYLYLNLSGWSGETPMFSWKEMKKTLAIAKEKKSQGVIWEASPAKFGSLPYLLAANSNLITGKDADSTLQEFCNSMFGDAAATIYKMLQMFGDEKTTVEKYKIQLYFQLLKTADQQTQNAPTVIKERLQELKAYLHYMVLYFGLENDERTKAANKEERDAALCLYLAKTNKLQLVNSFYIIPTITSKYAITTSFYTKYNTATGTAYLNGNLPLITGEEIESNFVQDCNRYSNLLQAFVLEDAINIKPKLNNALLAPKDTINVKLGYTNGLYYYNKTTFNITAEKAGSFTIQYTPHFQMPGYGYINFVVESTDKALQVVKDFSIDNTSTGGTITVNLPQAGNYVFTEVAKYKSAVDLTIITNGNYFFKNGAFLGNRVESYRDDTKSLPGYFYVPNATAKIYFTVNNSFSDGKFAAADAVGNSFAIKDNKGNLMQPKFVTPADSTLFYFDVPEAAAGSFWQATTMGQYNLSFVNISNVLWFAQPKAATTKPNLNPEAGPVAATAPLLFPNPSTGVFNCKQNGSTVIAQEIIVYNTQGTKIGSFKNANQFNISNAAAGVYFYQMVVDGVMHKGKAVKM